MPVRTLQPTSDPVSMKNLAMLPRYFARGLRYHAAGRIYTPKPSYASLGVTSRCNSRCVMCRVWRGQGESTELSLDQIRGLFENRLFDSVEKFVLGGGEPTLREDLADVARVMLECCPRTSGMTLITNGLDPVLVERRVRELLALPGMERLDSFAVSVSLDGYSDTCDSIRGVPQAFERVDETLRRLSEIRKLRPFYLCSTCVVQRSNAGDLLRLRDYGRSRGLPVIFSPVCVSNVYVDGPESGEELLPTVEQLEELKAMFAHDFESMLMPSNVPFWAEYFDVLSGRSRRLPCFLLHHYASVDSDGTMRICPGDRSLAFGSALETPPDELWYSGAARETRRRAKREFCPTCTVCCDMAFCFSHEFFYFARFLAKDRAGRLLARMGGAARNG